MPTYEYRCPKGHVFEKFSPQMTSRRRLRCPTCGQLAERLISGSGLVFKGSGFYITDYKRAGAQPAESDAKSEAKTETKSEVKQETKASETKASESKAPESKAEKPKTPKKDK
jgi:putative FmdB family regulatory protein